MNLTRYLADQAKPFANKTALEWKGETLSFEGFFAAVASHAVFLQEQGIKPGDRVALYLPKGLDFIYCHFAIQRLGGVSLPLNPAYTEEELDYFLQNSGAVLLITDREVKTGKPLPRLNPAAMETTQKQGSFPDSRPDDPALLCYTSGTTGKPKGAVISHENLIHNMQGLNRTWRLNSDDVLLHALPLFHIHGLAVALQGALNAGATTLLLENFDPAVVTDFLGRGRANLFMGVPTLYARLLAWWEEQGAVPDLSSMRLFVSGSAPLSEPLFQRFKDRTGHTLLERYGMTETGMIASNPYDPARRKRGSVGYPLPGLSVRIRDGEVQVKGPSVFKGYLSDPEKTAAAFDGPWFKTGDLGRLDGGDEDRLYLAGRARDLIISGGLNVYPREVEEILCRFEGVAEAAVVGIDHPDWGEQVIAFVVLHKGCSAEAGPLGEFARQHLAPYKCPRRIRFLPALPRNAMGKVDTKALVDALNK